MEWSVWIAFMVVGTAAIVTPGPGNLNTVRRVVQLGLRPATLCIFGNVLGLLVLGTLSATGIASILLAYPVLWILFSCAGSLYLIWLGIGQISAQTPFDPIGQAFALVSDRHLFLEAFAVSVSNPKAIVFYLAVFPQFLVADAKVATQLTVMVLSCGGISLVSHLGYAVIANRLRIRLASPSRYRIFQIASGLLLVAVGIGLLFGQVASWI